MNLRFASSRSGIRQLEKQIRLDVTNASIAVSQARETWEATRSERIFEAQTVADEQQKLEVGVRRVTSLFSINATWRPPDRRKFPL